MSFRIDNFDDVAKWNEVIVGSGSVTERTVESFKSNCLAENNVAGLVTVNPQDLTTADFSVLANRNTARTVLLVREDVSATPLTPSSSKYLYAFIRDAAYGIQILDGYGLLFTQGDPVPNVEPAEMRIVINGGVVKFYYEGQLVFSHTPPGWASFPFNSLYVYCLAFATRGVATTIGTTTFSTPTGFPFTVSISPSDSQYISTIESVLFTAIVGGATESYTVDWYVDGLKVASGLEYVFTSTEIGPHEIYAIATDSTTTPPSNTVTVNVEEVPTEILDNFNDNSLNVELWRIVVPIGRVDEQNGRIEVDPVESASGIRLRNRIDFRDLDIRVDRDSRRCTWIQLTLGYHPDCESDYSTLSWLTNYYSLWTRSAWNMLYISKSEGDVTQNIWEGTYSQPYNTLGIRIERHPEYPAEERYIIKFFDGETEIYSEECTSFIQAIGGMGVVELHSRSGLTIWDNFRFKKASTPEPTKYAITVEELSNSYGVVAPSSGIYSYPAGSEISFAAIPDLGYIFNGWVVTGEPLPEETFILTLNSNAIIQSNGFDRDPNYRLLSIRNNLGGVTDLPSGVNAIPIGNPVTVTVTPEMITPPGITPTFKHWLLDGVLAGTNLSIDVTMDEDHTLEPIWTAPVPHDTWFIRCADILSSTPPAQPIDGSNYDVILDDIVAHNTEKQEINHVLTRVDWSYNLNADPTGSTVMLKEAPPYSATLEQTRGAIRKIHEHGLKVAIGFTPEWGRTLPDGWINWDNPSPGFNPETFIQSYFDDYVIPLAQLCEEEGVELIIISWEMLGWATPNWNTQYNAKWSEQINRLRTFYTGMLGFNIQATGNKAQFETEHLHMDFLSDVDVIMLSGWFQMNHLPVDARDVAWGIWLDWYGEGEGSPFYTNFMERWKTLSETYGKKVYLNSGYQNGTGEIFAPWTISNPNAPLDPNEQLFAWKGALQAMRYQSWCAGYDLERYNETQVSHPPPYITTSWRYHPENQDAIFKEINRTLADQLPPPPTATLTIKCEPVNGGNTNPASGQHSYPIDEEVYVAAIPSEGWTFDHWTLDGENIGIENPTPVTMNEDHTLTAYFTPPPLDIGAIAIGLGIGISLSLIIAELG